MVSENNRIKRHYPRHTLDFQVETVAPYRISHNKKARKHSELYSNSRRTLNQY